MCLYRIVVIPADLKSAPLVGRRFEPSQLHQQTREDRIKLLAPLKSDYQTAKELKEQMQFEKEKLEISRGYTVAPAYNKGAYQVIPRTDVKHIGK